MDYQKNGGFGHRMYRSGSPGSGGNVRLSGNGAGQNRAPPVRFASDSQPLYQKIFRTAGGQEIVLSGGGGF